MRFPLSTLAPRLTTLPALLAAAALAACAPATTATTAPTPASVPASAPVSTPAPVAAKPQPAPAAVPASGPATNWQLLDDSTDRVMGTSVLRAERELLAGKTAQPVVVAVIDGGVDTAHADLRANLWVNPREVAGNKRDDDGDGHVDDVHGWDFIGGATGDVNYDTFEATRIYARCTLGDRGAGTGTPMQSDSVCKAAKADFEKQRTETMQTLPQIQQIEMLYSQIIPVLRQATGGDSLTAARVRALTSSDATVQQARMMYLRLADAGITPAAVADAKPEYEARAKFSLDTMFNPRTIVGDNYADPSQRLYGNTDVTGPDAKHGTHVAGIIAAMRDSATGIEGIAHAARILVVRAVPDGDERDKDIANAIRYATDHGARVINMSFGKGYSPFKSAVDDAVKYADAHGVLMVHAAGNDAENIDVKADYPTRHYLSGGTAQNWIEVGASSWHGRDSLAVGFSNYGQSVDLFAPGEDILSTVQGGGVERLSGTSMAAPVVSGIAALIFSYYPSLTAADVKRILLASATRYPGLAVVKPGNKPGESTTVPFSSLSSTGGIVNAYAALRMAAQAASTAH